MKENNNLSLSDLSDSTILRENESILSLLLKDHTTGKNIKWGTDSYINHGYSFRDDQEIKIDLITGWYEGFIRPRVDKDIDIQLERQRNRAEVFTPSWVIKLQVDAALEDMEKLPLTDFLKTKWLEITCGEAPYMVNRYDMETGEVIPLKDRAGFIDVKFKKLNEAIESEEEWLKLAVEIYKASYGYEYQGDSLLLARENLILTFIDNYFYMFGAFPKEKILLEITKIISLNVFQMDGLTHEVPYSSGGTEEFGTQLSLFEVEEEIEEKTPKLAKLKLWHKNELIKFKELLERNDLNMKFDVVIGNPPYQKNDNGQRDDGAVNASASSIYPFFVESSQKISNIQSLIIPARWITGAGKGLKKFSEQMISSRNLKHFSYYANSKDVFPNNEITGGVCYFIRDNQYEGKTHIKAHFTNRTEISTRVFDEHSIGVFIPFETLSNILLKIRKKVNLEKNSIYPHVSVRKPYGLSTDFLDKPKKYDLTRLQSKREMKDDIEVFGLIKGKRTSRFIPSNYKLLKGKDLRDFYKVFVTKAYGGDGILGESDAVTILGQPLIGKPRQVSTETYLTIGKFETEEEANSLYKYIKTKFFRVLVGILKTTQDAPRRVYQLVPIQNFTSKSDIDWTKPIAEIDQQLYEKYNLNEEEIDFIETNIKEMG